MRSQAPRFRPEASLHRLPTQMPTKLQGNGESVLQPPRNKKFNLFHKDQKRKPCFNVLPRLAPAKLGADRLAVVVQHPCQLLRPGLWDTRKVNFSCRCRQTTIMMKPIQRCARSATTAFEYSSGFMHCLEPQRMKRRFLLDEVCGSRIPGFRRPALQEFR